MEKSLFNPHQKPRPFIIEAVRRNAVNRILVMLFALLLIPQCLWAQVLHTVYYDIWIGGIQVTNTYCGDLAAAAVSLGKSDSVVVSSDGYISFDPSTNTLNLKDVELKRRITSGLSSLKIKFEGTCKVNSDSRLSGYGVSKQENAILSTYNVGGTKAALSFEKSGDGTLELDGKEYNPAVIGFESVSYGSGCYMKAAVPTLYDPAQGYVNFGLTGNKTDVVMITSDVTYPLWVQGIQVDDNNAANVLKEPTGNPTVVFVSSNNTLKLKEAYISGKIQSALGDLVVSVSGVNTITADSGSLIRSANGSSLTIKKEESHATLALKIDVATSIYPVIQGFETLSYTTDFDLNTPATEPKYGDFNLTITGASSVQVKGLYDDAVSGKAAILSATFVKKYDLWVGGTQVTSANLDNIGPSGTDFSFDPDESTLHYRDGGSTAYSVHSGLPNLTIKIGTPSSSDPTNYSINNISTIKFGSPNGEPVAAASGTLTFSKEENFAGVQQFDIVAYGSEPSLIQGFDDVTYSDFVIMQDGAVYNTTTKQLEYPNPYGSGYVGLDATTTFRTPQDISGFYVADIPNQDYTGSPLNANITVKETETAATALVENTDYTVSYQLAGAAATPQDAKPYDVIITGKGLYTGSITNKTFTIDPASATITAANQTVTYNGAAQAISGVSVDKGSVSVTYYNSAADRSAKTGGYTTAPTNADTYYVQVTQTDANYTSTPMDVTFNIDSLEVKLSWSNTSLTYNGAAQKPTATVTNLIGSDVCDVIVSGEQTDAGSHTATVIGLSNRNYKMPTAGLSETFTINAAPGTMTSPTALTLTYTGAEQNLVNAGFSTNGTVEYKLSDDDETKWGTTIPKKKDAGTYTVNYRLKGDSNHDDIASADLQVTIAPAIAALSWSNTSLTYNGAAQKPTATVTNLIGSDACTVTVSGGQTNAGSHTATASGLSNTNYTLPAAASENFTIAPVIAALSWSNTSLIYNGTIQAPTATVTNLIGSDVCTVTVSGGQTNAGSYTATASSLSNTNYTLPTTGLTQNFTISDRTATFAFKTGRTFQTFYAANETFLVPDGVTAYIVTGVNGKSLTVTKVPMARRMRAVTQRPRTPMLSMIVCRCWM